MVWRTVRPVDLRRARRPRRPSAARSARPGAAPSALSAPGGSQSPVSSGPSRRTMSTRPRRPMSATSWRTASAGRRGAGGGNSSTRPRASARHGPRTGQRPQAGARGVQMVAPNSITAWFQSPGRRIGTSVPANAHRRRAPRGSRMAAGIANSRERTRATFPSSTGSGRSKHMERTAPVVYRPTPGRQPNASGSSGTRPPCSRTTARAAWCRWRARR